MIKIEECFSKMNNLVKLLVICSMVGCISGFSIKSTKFPPFAPTVKSLIATIPPVLSQWKQEFINEKVWRKWLLFWLRFCWLRKTNHQFMLFRDKIFIIFFTHFMIRSERFSVLRHFFTHFISFYFLWILVKNSFRQNLCKNCLIIKFFTQMVLN